MDMRWTLRLGPDSGPDVMVQALSQGFGCEEYFYLLAMVQGLPDDDVNKPELQRYVERARRAAHDRNLDALEGWLNALAVGVKSVRLYIPKTAGKVRQEAANSKNAQADRKGSPEDIEAFRVTWLATNYPRTRGLQKAIQLEFGIKDVRTINRKRMKAK